MQLLPILFMVILIPGSELFYILMNKIFKSGSSKEFCQWNYFWYDFYCLNMSLYISLITIHVLQMSFWQKVSVYSFLLPINVTFYHKLVCLKFQEE